MSFLFNNIDDTSDVSFTYDLSIKTKPYLPVDHEKRFNSTAFDGSRIIIAQNIVYDNPGTICAVRPFLFPYVTNFLFNNSEDPDTTALQETGASVRLASVINSCQNLMMITHKSINAKMTYAEFFNQDVSKTGYEVANNGIAHVRYSTGHPARFLLDCFRQRNESYYHYLRLNAQVATKLPFNVTCLNAKRRVQVTSTDKEKIFKNVQTNLAIEGIDALYAAGNSIYDSSEPDTAIIVEPGCSAPFALREDLLNLPKPGTTNAVTPFTYNEYHLILANNMQRNSPEQDPVEATSYVEIKNADVGLPTRPPQIHGNGYFNYVFGDQDVARPSDYKVISVGTGAMGYYDPVTYNVTNIYPDPVVPANKVGQWLRDQRDQGYVTLAPSTQK